MARSAFLVSRLVPVYLIVLGCVGMGRADELVRLEPIVHLRSAEPLPPAPETSPPPAVIRQAAQSVQPEGVQRSGAFSGPVPVDTLVRYALANNPEIQAARYRARQLGARVPQAASLGDPQLMTIAFLESIQTAAGPQQVAMSLSQKVPWFGKLALRSQVAYYDAMAAYAQLAAVELSVAERVKRSYYDLYYLQRAIDVNRSLEPRIRDVIDITKTKYETNRAGLESLYQAQIELSALKTRLVELGQAKIESQARLAATLHLPPRTMIDAEPTLKQTVLTQTAQLLVELAESYQPQLAARGREISRDQAAIDLAWRNYWPDVTVSFNWFGIGSEGISPVATGEDAYSLGVGVNVPLWRKRLDAAVREAQYKTAQSARQYAATLDQVRAEVQALYAEFRQHQQVLEILEGEIVPRSARTLELSIAAYDVGKLGFQQMIDNYTSLLKYEIELHRREALRLQAIASLERAVGCTLAASSAGP